MQRQRDSLREHNRGDQTIWWNERKLTRSELREEFPPEFTDEKRNEWLKWIDDRSKQYSIDPVTVKPSIEVTTNNTCSSGIVVYATRYGTLEVPEQFVENYVTKPVDSIMKARALRGPLVIDEVTKKGRSTKQVLITVQTVRCVR